MLIKYHFIYACMINYLRLLGPLVFVSPHPWKLRTGPGHLQWGADANRCCAIATICVRVDRKCVCTLLQRATHRVWAIHGDANVAKICGTCASSLDAARPRRASAHFSHGPTWQWPWLEPAQLKQSNYRNRYRAIFRQGCDEFERSKLENFWE
jgi:hypothetical protein